MDIALLCVEECSFPARSLPGAAVPCSESTYPCVVYLISRAHLLMPTIKYAYTFLQTTFPYSLDHLQGF